MRNRVYIQRINLLIAVLLAAQLGASALAQSQASGGAIQGTVTDSNGAVVAEAKVRSKSLQTGIEREANTGSDGLYRFTLLPVGDYDIAVSKQGFAETKLQGIKVQVGQTITLDVSLNVAGAAESVNVTAEAPVVESSRTQVSAIVNDRSVSNLPANGRNFIDFVLLTPGVVRSPRSGDISFGGQQGTL